MDEKRLPGCVVLRTTGRRGAAAARNAAMRHAKGDLIAFLDDDDEWLPHHLAVALKSFREHPEVDVVSSRAFVREAGVTRVLPTDVYRSSRSVADYMYGRDMWRSRNRRIMTPTLVFRRSVDVLMDETMSAREDLWWLLNVEARGHRLFQNVEATVIINSDAGRGRAREGLAEWVAWADKIDGIRPGSGNHFLVGVIGRLLARQGRIPDLDLLRKTLAGRRLSLPQELILGCEWAACRVFRLIHLQRRRQ